MNTNDIKTFLESIRDTDIEEIEFEAGDTSLYIKKSEIAPKKEVPKKVVEKNITVSIKSKMVGTFYSAPANDRPPFVIGTIEAMKIIKDVISTTKGKILKVLVANGQTVEYGQKLFLVDTDSK